MADQETPLPAQSEPPNGMYPGRVDEKGRLKLPVDFQEYFRTLTETKFFVTTTDRRIGQIYPIAEWREIKRKLSGYHDDPRAARTFLFNANRFGGDCEMDSQGRLLLPPEMRRHLAIENEAVQLQAYRNHVQILSQAIFDEEDRLASQDPLGAADVLERAGVI